MYITHHAYARAKERFGLGKESIERLALRAWERGKYIHSSMDSVTIKYGEKLFVFVAGNLVTVSGDKRVSPTKRVYIKGKKTIRHMHR
jgi:hypothetical protein